MDIEKQTTSFELSKELFELGVKQDSMFWWSIDKSLDMQPVDENKNWIPTCIQYVENGEVDGNNVYSAFTVAELGEMLKEGLYKSWRQTTGLWACSYVLLSNNDKEILEYGKTEADARAKMLIYLIKRKLI